MGGGCDNNPSSELAEGAGDCVEEQDTVRKEKGTYVKDVECKNVTNTDDCEHLRGGWCVVHKLQGRKSTKLFKTWEKLRTGLCGWKVRSKVIYSCEFELQPYMSSVQPGPSVSFTKTTESGRGWVTGGIIGISRMGKPGQPGV